MVRERTSIFFKVCAVFCATSIAIAAAETSSSSPADPLAAAKRDYEAFKILNGTQASQQGELNLRRSLPPLATTVDAPPMPSPIQRARKLESVRALRSSAHSANWLVDGVKNNSGSSTDRSGLSSVDELAGEPEASALDHLLNEPSTAAGLQKRGANRRTQEIESNPRSLADRSIETYNPLDSYMSKWMTPGDFELLKSNPERSGAAGGTLPSARLETLTSVPSSPDVLALPFAVETGFDGRSSPLGLKSGNPYLAELPLPVAPVSSQRVSSSLMPAIPAPSATTHTSAPPPAKPSLADALKAEDDAKFFKQLKRF